jgi:two-component system, chemotaxis family, chemotaxis protein CheY
MPSQRHEGEAMKALVIDDSRVVRMIAGRALEELGFEVTEAANGQEALDRLSDQGNMDLALVDWNMPIMTGIEFVSEVRKRPSHDAMQLVMLTTETAPERMAGALEAGANEYLMKPFDKVALREKLQLVGLPI